MDDQNKFGFSALHATATGVTLIGDSGDNELRGSTDNDKISGFAGDDDLFGLAGNDTLNGGGDDDELFGGSGNDALFGGDGFDRLSGGNGNDTLDGGGGIDDQAVYSDATAAVRVNLGLTGVQNTQGAGLDTLLNIEAVLGSAFNDVLTGNASTNLLSGEKGNDTLLGSGGADVLMGGIGSDVLSGGLGNDNLNGGLGKDFFRFDTALNASTNVDDIFDFGWGADDRMQLDNAVFKKLTVTGALNAANFHASANGNAADNNDFILYNTTNDTMYYDADGSGAGGKIAFAVIGGISGSISANDIQVI